MAQNIGEIYATLGLRSSKFEARLRAVENKMSKFEVSAKKAEDATEKVGRASARAEGRVRRLGNGLDRNTRISKRLSAALKRMVGGLGLYTLVRLGRTVVKLGMDFEETTNVLKVAFGKSAGAIDVWAADMGAALGRSQQQMRKTAGTFQYMLSAMLGTREEALEFSKAFAQLTVDMGSFFNISDERAFHKLRAGLSGEVEPLRQLGVIMTNKAIQDFLSGKGIKVNLTHASEAVRTHARMLFILERTKFAHDDASETIGSMANQVKVLQGLFTDIGTLIGGAINEDLVVVVMLINYAVLGMIDLAKTAEDFGDAIDIAFTNWPVIGSAVKAFHSVGAFAAGGAVAGLIAKKTINAVYDVPDEPETQSQINDRIIAGQARAGELYNRLTKVTREIDQAKKHGPLGPGEPPEFTLSLEDVPGLERLFSNLWEDLENTEQQLRDLAVAARGFTTESPLKDRRPPESPYAERMRASEERLRKADAAARGKGGKGGGKGGGKRATILGGIHSGGDLMASLQGVSDEYQVYVDSLEHLAALSAEEQRYREKMRKASEALVKAGEKDLEDARLRAEYAQQAFAEYIQPAMRGVAGRFTDDPYLADALGSQGAQAAQGLLSGQMPDVLALAGGAAAASQGLPPQVGAAIGSAVTGALTAAAQKVEQALDGLVLSILSGSERLTQAYETGKKATAAGAKAVGGAFIARALARVAAVAVLVANALAMVIAPLAMLAAPVIALNAPLLALLASVASAASALPFALSFVGGALFSLASNGLNSFRQKISEAAQAVKDKLLELATSTESYKTLQNGLEAVFARVTKALEPFWTQLYASVAMLFMLAETVARVIEPLWSIDAAGRALFEVLKQVAIAATKMEITFYSIMAGMSRFLAHMMGLIGATKTQTWLLTFATRLEQQRAKAYQAEIKLKGMEYEQAKKMGMAIGALNEELQSATLNLPAGYKLALAQYNSQDGGPGRSGAEQLLGGSFGSGFGRGATFISAVVHTSAGTAQALVDDILSEASKSQAAGTEGFMGLSNWGMRG